MLFPVLYICTAIYLRVRPKSGSEMDFVTGLKEIEAVTYDDPPPRNWVERFWGWLVSSHFPITSFLPLTSFQM